MAPWPSTLSWPLTGRPLPLGLSPRSSSSGRCSTCRFPSTWDRGKLLGLVGPRGVTTAMARGLLLQAVVHQGPADLAVLVAADEITVPGWAWTAWLPHIVHPAIGRARLVTDHRSVAAEIAAEIADAWDRRAKAHWPQLLIMADGENLATGRTPPLRPLLQGSAGPVSAIVLASSVDQLPATATAIIDARDPSGTVDLLQSGETTPAVLATGMSLGLARTTARSLARFEDPEQPGANTGTPDRASLIDLLGLPAPDGPAGIAGLSALTEAVAALWRQAEHTDGLAAPIGADGHGPLLADLASDGPHALVGGTTGSGKSELLRTLVASLAATYSPEQVNFVLVDYKGGSAFDACASLPHVVGLVTDLDDRLAERALRCLEAELRHREQMLRDRGATDLVHYRALARSSVEEPGAPLARLVVIIDEFAALAAELPGFMDSLVNVAQRGRSLGHALGVGHPAPCWSGERQHPHQHRAADRLAGVGHRRLCRRTRQPGGRCHRSAPAWTGIGPIRSRRIGGVPMRPGHRGHRRSSGSSGRPGP